MDKKDFVENLKAIVGVFVLGTALIISSAAFFTVAMWAFKIAFRLID